MSRFQILILPVLVIALSSATGMADEYPEATATSKPNVVVSPFPPNKKIDITGFLPGDLARDPHTNKVFRVPAKRATPLVFKPEVIEDDPSGTPTIPRPPAVAPESLPVVRPKILEGPDGIARPPAVPEILGSPGVNPGTPAIVKSPPAPVVPVRAPREMDGTLSDFVKTFVRSGQDDDPNAQLQFVAEKVTRFYSLEDAGKDLVRANRETQISRWPRRIYVVSGKPRFVRWISAEEEEDEFVVDIRVYQSLKNSSETTKRGYADHRLSIHEKADGSFEITGAEERHPRSVLAGQ